MRSFLVFGEFFSQLRTVSFGRCKTSPKYDRPHREEKASIFWTAEADEAFIQIRHLIARCPLLHFMDEHSPVELYTDLQLLLIIRI